MKTNLDWLNTLANKFKIFPSFIKSDLKKYSESIIFKFAEFNQDEIIKFKAVKTRRLLNSFNIGTPDNISEKKRDKITVGTKVEYASNVNQKKPFFDISVTKINKFIDDTLEKKIEDWTKKL